MNNLRRCCNFLIGVAIISAGTPEVISETIVAHSTVPAPDVSPAIILPIHCDTRGDIFLQPPLSEIAEDGKRLATFDLAAAAGDGLQGPVLKAFAVDPGGSLYQLVKTTDQRVAIVKFDRDGQYVRSLIVDQQFEPQQIAVFAGDAFLIAGIVVSKEGANLHFSPFVGLFDKSGRLVKRIDTVETSDAAAFQDYGKGDSKAPSSGNAFNLPELGIAESDGTSVFLLRQGSSPSILVVSAAGDMERTIKLAAPYPDTNVSGFRVGAGQLLVEYARPRAMPNGNTAYYLTLYDSQSGNKLADYTRDPDLTGILACTDWRGNFTLVSADRDGKRVLIKASSR